MGTGLSDQNLKEFHEKLKDHVTDNAKSYYRVGQASKPDVWFEPSQVRSRSPRHSAIQSSLCIPPSILL